jgi:hypothetical protein
MELWKSLQMIIWAILQLATSAASCHILTTKNDSTVNYWPGQLFLIFMFTLKCLPICKSINKLAVYNFPIFSMVNKPNQIIFGYSSNWITKHPSNNLLHLIWSKIHGERASKFNSTLIMRQSVRPERKYLGPHFPYFLQLVTSSRIYL